MTGKWWDNHLLSSHSVTICRLFLRFASSLRQCLQLLLEFFVTFHLNSVILLKKWLIDIIKLMNFYVFILVKTAKFYTLQQPVYQSLRMNFFLCVALLLRSKVWSDFWFGWKCKMQSRPLPHFLPLHLLTLPPSLFFIVFTAAHTQHVAPPQQPSTYLMSWFCWFSPPVWHAGWDRSQLAFWSIEGQIFLSCSRAQVAIDS